MKQVADAEGAAWHSGGSPSSCFRSAGVRQHNQAMAAPPSRRWMTSGRAEDFASAGPSSSARTWPALTSAPTRTTSGRRSTSAPPRHCGRVCGGGCGPARGAPG
jgi:hypothetical protein